MFAAACEFASSSAAALPALAHTYSPRKKARIDGGNNEACSMSSTSPSDNEGLITTEGYDRIWWPVSDISTPELQEQIFVDRLFYK